MAEHLYLGPVNKQLRGNREDALRLEREARTKVGYLFDSMRPGETFKTGSWSLLDGRRIMAFVWNDVLGKRATVRLTGIGEEVVAVCVFTMNSGWLAWKMGEAGIGDFRVFLWSDEDPEREDRFVGRHKLEIANGIVLKSAISTVAAETNSTTFSGLREYTTLCYLPTENYTSASCAEKFQPDLAVATLEKESELTPLDLRSDMPEKYSGLMRLFAQAVLATGRKITSLFSGGIPYFDGPNAEENFLNDFLPGRMGCIRSPNKEYWIVHTGITGAHAWQVILDDCVSQTLKQLIFDTESDMPQDMRIWLEGWLLSTATLGTKIELLPSDDVQVLAIHNSETPLYVQLQPWGWCWRNQMVGADDQDICGAVTIRYEFVENVSGYNRPRSYTAECRLEIEFDEDTNLPVITRLEQIETNQANIAYCSYQTTENIRTYNGVMEDITAGMTVTPPSGPAEGALTKLAASYLPDGTIGYVSKQFFTTGYVDIFNTHTYTHVPPTSYSTAVVNACDVSPYNPDIVMSNGGTITNGSNYTSPSKTPWFIVLSESPGAGWINAYLENGSDSEVLTWGGYAEGGGRYEMDCVENGLTPVQACAEMTNIAYDNGEYDIASTSTVVRVAGWVAITPFGEFPELGGYANWVDASGGQYINATAWHERWDVLEAYRNVAQTRAGSGTVARPIPWPNPYPTMPYYTPSPDGWPYAPEAIESVAMALEHAAITHYTQVSYGGFHAFLGCESPNEFWPNENNLPVVFDLELRNDKVIRHTYPEGRGFWVGGI